MLDYYGSIILKSLSDNEIIQKFKQKATENLIFLKLLIILKLMKNISK